MHLLGDILGIHLVQDVLVTTVALPKNEMGKFAVYLLLDRIRGEHRSVTTVELEGALVIREISVSMYTRRTAMELTDLSRPKTFEIDCLVGDSAHEIKWRDATTDGDHIIKERTRIKVIKEMGFVRERCKNFR